MDILLTGASGFVGSALSSALVQSGAAVEPFSFSGMLGGQTVSPTRSHDVCIHLAARVHVMNDTVAEPLAEFRRCNVAGTAALARIAADAGVRRFIFVSSIKVNGELTPLTQPFTAGDVPAPQDPYGLSKLEAEVELRKIGAESGMEIVIVRPPLVYGPGVKANFAALMRLIYRGIPLPIASIQNKRSLVGLGNLVSLLELCVVHPEAANQTFLVSDGKDMSTAELAKTMGEALGRPARLMPVPEAFLKAGARLLGKSGVAQRLCGSLVVDISKTKDLLGWMPPISIETEMQRTAQAWLSAGTGARKA